MKIKLFLFLLLLVVQRHSWSQEKKKLEDIVAISGYIKYLPSLSFTNSGHLALDHLIHHRINTRTQISNAFNLGVDFRNRLFFGETVSSTPYYGQLVDQDNGEVDLSHLWVEGNDFIAHTIVDRAYLDFSKGNWEIRAGRQRINWGINLAWNANDLFNVYNIVDFDYQERPGADALRLQFHTGDISHVEMAYKPGRSLDESIIASLFKFNTLKYDFQLIAANYYADAAFGGGWAGNIKNAGFKGEATYFQTKKNRSDTSGLLSLSTSLDYSFKKGIYANASFLFNSSGLTSSNGNSLLFGSDQLTAKSLMPSKYAYFTQLTAPIYPQLNGNLSIIYGQGVNILFLMPSFNYSLHENWDLNLTTQIYFGEQQGSFKNLGNSIFLRVQFSY